MIAPDSLQSGLPPSNDRMMTMLFLAALAHGILILGVGFSSSASEDGPAPALEVVLVGDQTPEARDNPHAKYLAERSQWGAGNSYAGQRTRIPKSSPAKADQAGLADGELEAREAVGSGDGADELLASRAPAPRILYFADRRSSAAERQTPLHLEARPNLGMMETDDGVELRLRGEQKSQLWIAADTRQSDVAVYLDTWCRKIERVGTINFPAAARRAGLTGAPVVEVVIGSDGRLVDAVIRHSSGYPELDQAALQILRLAAPYDAFPRKLALAHDELRIAREWHFLDGATVGGSVFYADPAPATP